MNFADAIRKASQETGAPLYGAPMSDSSELNLVVVESPPSHRLFSPKPDLPTPNRPEPEALSPVVVEPMENLPMQGRPLPQPESVPEPPGLPAGSGSIVRLELFLSPEQLSGLFRAVVANQHTVMTLREAAAYLRMNQKTLAQMAQRGQIPALSIDGKWRFSRNAVDEWLNLHSGQNEEQR